MHATVVGPPAYSDDVIHRHVLVSDELDSTLQLVMVSVARSRTEECIEILKTFCRDNGIEHFLVVNNDVVAVTTTGGGGRVVEPYGLLYVPSNQAPNALRDEPRSEFGAVDVQRRLDPKYNVRIVITECRLYPSLVESIVRAYPCIRYWDAVNSSVLNPRVMSAWHTLLHLNTLKLSLLNCVDPSICRVQLMHWPTNHLQRLLVLGTAKEDKELCEHIRVFYRYLVHFAYLFLYPHETPAGPLLVHMTTPQYDVVFKPWMRRSETCPDDAYDEESVPTTLSKSLRDHFDACKIQVIGDSALVAEVLV